MFKCHSSKYSISVIITCYNYGHYLSTALNSVFEQTYSDYEIIIVDDGSTDDTQLVVESFGVNTKIKYIYQANLGQPKAKNRGINESSGELIAFLDADDIWMPTKLEKQIALFEDAEVGVVFSRRIWIDPDGNELPGNERILRRGKVLDHIFIDNFICFSSSVVRRSLLEEAGCFDETLPMGIDYDLWIRLAARCTFDYVDEPLVKYRTGHANLSKNVLRRYECAHRIMDRALNDPEIRSGMSWWVPRVALADTWANKGYYARKMNDFAAAASCYLKSVSYVPFYTTAWKGLLCCLLKRA